jgi:hypothetical protein
MTTNRAILPLLTVLLGVIILSNSAYAWSWQPYYHAQNVTVANWDYIQGTTTNAITYRESGYSPVNYALVTVNSIDPTKLKIYGYSITKALLGQINYSVFWHNGTYSYILLPNKTVSGAKWVSATIFDAPIGWQSKPYSLNPSSYSLYIPAMTSLTPPYKKIYDNIIGNHSFVIFRSNTPNTTIHYYPDAFNHFSINYTTNINLTSYGILGTTRINSTYYDSLTSNNLKLGLPQEAYFSHYADQILTNRMYVNETKGKMYNISTNAITQGAIYNMVTPYFNISDSISYYITPSFTTNVIVGNVVNNPLPSSLNTSINGWYGAYNKRILISNLTDNYTFWSYTPPAAVTDNTINRTILHAVTYNGVPYKIVESPYKVTFGTSCTDIYIRTYNNITKTDYGSVPFYVLSCNPNTKLLLSNRTSLNYGYTSAYLYYEMPYIDSGTSQWNNSVYNDWYLANTANSLISLSVSAMSELTLSSIITSDSYGSHISLGHPTTNSVLVGQHINFTPTINNKESLIMYDAYGTNSGNVVNTQNTQNTKFLIGSAFGQYMGNAANFFLGKNLISHTIFGNLTYIGNISATKNSYPNNYYYMEIRLNTITATLTKLYSTNYTLGAPETKLTTIFNVTPPIDIGNTTTIDYTHGTLNQTRTIYTGVTLKVWEIYILATICILIMTFTLNPDQPFIFVCGLIFLVILGILEWALMIIAAMALLFFIMYEYTQKKR